MAASKITTDLEENYHYRLLAETIRELILVYDLSGKITYINKAGLEFSGYCKEEILGQHFSKFIPKKYHDEILNNISLRDFGETRPFRYELEILKKNGETVPFELTSTLFDQKSETKSVLLVGRDISERKRISERIRNQNFLLEILINTIPDPIFYKDTQGNYLGCNKAFEEFIGIRSEELKGKSVFDVHPPELASIYAEQDKLMLANPGVRVFEEKVRYADGSIHLLVYHKATFLDANGRIAGLVGISHDITQRKNNEAELRKLSLAVEQGVASIVITDIQGNIEYVNRKFMEVIGYSKEEVIGKNPRILQSGSTPPETYEQLWNTILSGDVWHGNFVNEAKNGQLFWERASISPVRDDSGTITHFIAIKEDVTERRQLEDQFYQAQKMEAIGKLAGGVAHDFNNLLSVINGYSDLILRDIDENHIFYHDILEILNTGRRAAGLTNQLLAFSRKQVLSLEILNLNDVITNLNRMLKRLIGEDIELVQFLDSNLAKVKLDRVQFEQIMLNLAVNARDAMPDGGKLTIETANVELTADDSNFKRNVIPGKYINVIISDTGEGMDKETQQRIFEPFFTTKKRGEGTGLGLATVYGIVKQSKGYIWVYSELGKGTTFKLYFPYVKEEKEQAKRRKFSQKRIHGKEKILLVEDDQKVRDYVKRVLSGYGYSVSDAASGDEALDIINKNDTIHLLLTDVVMPGMSGRKIAEILQSIHTDLKVLYMSGYTDNAILHHQVLEPGINFITKPFTPFELAKKVREALEEE